MDRSGMEWKQERVETRTERRARPLRTSPSARAVRVTVGPPPPLPHPMQRRATLPARHRAAGLILFSGARPCAGVEASLEDPATAMHERARLPLRLAF